MTTHGSQPIGELTNRMRDIFGLVVEAYLERGAPVGSKALAGSDQPLAGLDPRCLAGSGGARPADPPAYLGRPNPDRERPAPVRRRDHAGRGARCARAARDRAPDRPRPADRRRAGGRFVGFVGPVAGCRRRSRAEARARLKQLNFVPLGGTRALAVLVGADGSVENRIVSLDEATSAGGADRGQQFRQRAPCRPDACRGRSAAARRNPRAQGSNRRGGRRAGRFGTRGLEPRSPAPAGADRARPRQADRRDLRRGPRPGQPAARRARGSAGDRPAARGRARCAGVPHLHRFGEPDVRFFGLIGDCRAVSREPGRGGRRCGGDRPDAVELCARGSHGGFHSQSTDEIDGMTEDGKLHDEAEDIRDQTAEGRPSCASTTASPSWSASSRRPRARRSMRPPRPRTCAAGWSRSCSRRPAMPRRTSPATC